MLAAYCPRHRGTVLFSESRITTARNTSRGVEVELDCYCGQHLLVRRGRTVVAEPQPA